ncbi:MAG: lytic murein transglycosylase [Brucellaceae bacterium]|nr:lytic murein transglycosylase [Brucellaceae bacterium]
MASKAKTFITALGLVLGMAVSGQAFAAQCGNNAGGFEAWKKDFAREAASAGVGKRGLSALAGTRYATDTISADRNQKSFRYSFDQFMKIRGGNTIISKGRSLKKSNAKLFSALEKRYGVTPGPLLAIWGMETGFGSFMGNSNVVSAVATLAYDCRRTEFFQGHLIAALKLVDRGSLSASTRGAKHGEVGHTQFLTGNVLRYGVDGNGDGRVDLTNKADALASTANFLRSNGMRGRNYDGGGGYGAIQAWNAAGVYQKAIAYIAAAIDGG